MEKITSQIHKQFRHNRLAKFDEMNVLQTKKHINTLYARTYKDIIKEFNAVFDDLIKYIYEFALDYGFDGEISELQNNFVEELFSEYNPVMKYVFNREYNRKRDRLFESLIAYPGGTEQSYKTAENLLIRQITEFSVLYTDNVMLAVYEELGVQYVKWVTEEDSRVCHICRDLDGTVYKITDAPEKAHPNCRCYLIPYKKSEKT